MNYPSLVFSVISSICTLFVSIPQTALIYNNKSSIGVSTNFLFIRIFGNILIYLSAQEKGLDIIVVVMSIFSLLMDLIIFAMVIYGRTFSSQNELILNKQEKMYLYFIALITLILKVFMSDIVSDIIAWVATILFVISIMPQLHLNHRLKCMTNFSIKTMILRDLSITSYLLSIILLIKNKNDALSMLQWLCGMSLNLLFDSVIYIQYFMYKDNHEYEELV